MKKRPHLDRDDAPELTRKLARKLRPVKEVLSSEQYAMLPKKKIGERGKQKAPTKTPVTIRLDPEIINFFKSLGEGWQSRINDFLKAAVVSLR